MLAKDRFATDSNPRDVASSTVDANDYSIRADAERPLGDWRMVLGADVNGRYNLEAVNEYTTFGSDGEPIDVAREESIENASGTDLGLFMSLERSLGIWQFNFGAPRRRGVEQERRRIFWRPEHLQLVAFRVCRSGRRDCSGPRSHRPGGEGIPRPVAVRPLLPGRVGARVHHRQPRSRTGDQPPARLRAALQPRLDGGRASTSTATGSTI